MRLPLLLASAIALAACTAHDTPSDGNGTAAKGNATASATHSAPAPRAHRARAIAGLPDRGQLLAYTASAPSSRSAYTWHSVALSEDHALNAIATGTLDVPAPDGSTIALKFDHAVDHGDGNWTWVGRPAGTQPGTEAIITFGPKAVFGTVPYGRKPALRIGSAQGRTFLMETDPVKLARLVKAGHRPTGPDYVVPPALAGARDKVLQRAAAQPKPQALVAAGAVPESNTVDVVLGYTNGFASRLGGASQAVTRLNHLVAVANQAFTNSQINGRIRLVGTVPVTYPDNTDNETVLRALSGVTCTELDDGSLDCDEAPIPAALQPLVTKREQLHADLMSIVRNFTTENVSCGIAWLIGSGEKPISADDAYAGISVISDSNGSGDDDSSGAPFPDDGYVCRNETLAHELAHNMGSAHDATTAAGDDGLTLNEHGRYPYSFGYKTDAGAFYTIMSYGDDGQTAYRIYSNPRTNYCGGMACGTADADNARSLNSTIPVIASFYTTLVSPKVARSDFNGDGKSDAWFRNVNGYNMVWLSANIHTPQTMKGVAAAWQIVGMGDFDGDDRADVMWRNVSSGQNVIWRSGLASTPQAMAVLAGADWKVKGVIDIDGDGLADVLWRNEVLGQNRIWKSGNAATLLPVANLSGTAWKIVGVGDFEGDGKGDILWRNSTSGLNVIWRNGNSATPRSLQTLADQGWQVAGVGDFDGDAKSDVLWRHTNGANAIWRSGNSATPKTIAGVAAAWQVKCVADFNGDGDDDLLFRNGGANVIWRSGSSTTAQAMSAADVAWSVNC